MELALKTNHIPNLLVEKLIREASDNFSYNRDYDLALEQVDRALTIEQFNTKALILKGDILFCMDKDKEALDYFERAIKSDPCSAEAFGSKAGILEVFGQHSEALACCDKAFKLVRARDKFLLPSLYDLKLTLLLRVRRFEEARRILNRALEILPEDDSNYLYSCYKTIIDCSCRLRKTKLERAEKLSLKVI
jgi:tetratricopeptide (TPR) repeat protein